MRALADQLGEMKRRESLAVQAKKVADLAETAKMLRKQADAAASTWPP